MKALFWGLLLAVVGTGIALLGVDAQGLADQHELTTARECRKDLLERHVKTERGKLQCLESGMFALRSHLPVDQVRQGPMRHADAFGLAR